MSFTDWLILGGVGLLLRSGLEKAAANRVEQEAEYATLMEDVKKHEDEWNRRHEVNLKRISTPCFFRDGISLDEFTDIANKCGKKLKRVKRVKVKGPVVYCTVESQSGYSEWEFKVDFNDWGHVTGTYWPQADNDDSSIPKHYGQMMSGFIHTLLSEKGICLEDLSDVVDENKDLGTDRALSYCYKTGFMKKLFGKVDSVNIGRDSKTLIGEHIYPVISILKSRGFEKITSVPIKDVDNKSSKFIYEVEQIIVSGTGYFDSNDSFPADSEVILTYHVKREIELPMAETKMKRKNYIEVGDQLQALGFSEIYEKPIYDLTTGWIVKDGSVEKVTIGGKESYSKGDVFEFDTEIVIHYHTFSKKKK